MSIRTAGAVAELFDISCLSSTPEFARIQTDAFALWKELPNALTTLDLVKAFRILGNFDVLGQHYFVTSPSGTGISPKFDFTSGKFAGNPNAFILAAKAGDIPAPTGSADVDWLELSNVAGKLATEVFRVNTKAGQPAASVCSLFYCARARTH